MSLEYDFNTVMKFYTWAERLPDDIDFIDYWHNLFLSRTKARIESCAADNINAFHWTRWKEDFEEYVDFYKPVEGEGFTPDVRQWFGQYAQYLVYGLGLPSERIARHYGKDVFLSAAKDCFKYHTFGADKFISDFTAEYGLPPGAGRLARFNL